MKLSDYLTNFLVEKGISNIFMVSGGGIMHLCDSVGRQKGLRYICNYNEQACAVAAESYARLNGIGACLVTTGPGGTNAMTGVAGAYMDGIPIVIISGQVRREFISKGLTRQVGPQEGPIVKMAAPITKYAVTLMNPMDVRYELDKAFYLALTGRPGPVWLDVPLDVQAAEIDEAMLEGYRAVKQDPRDMDLDTVLDALHCSERPLFLFGNGILAANARGLMLELLERVRIPTILPHTAKDLLPEDHPLNIGVFGPMGNRCANFALQRADLLICIGTGLNLSKMGFGDFASRAKKIVVDIDEGQIMNVTADLSILADASDFIIAMLKVATTWSIPEWTTTCGEWKANYPIILPEHFRDKAYVNTYVFMDRLSDIAPRDSIIVTGVGLEEASCWQAFRVKESQRLLISGNWGSMGWDLPAAIGAAVGSGRRVLCLTGDGSIQFNIQELLTIQFNRLPVKIFVFNNNGYSNIRATQSNFFGRFVGADKGSGVGNTNFEKLASTYEISYHHIMNNNQIETILQAVLKEKGPSLCEINISNDQCIAPRVKSAMKNGKMVSGELDDMWPYLERE